MIVKDLTLICVILTKLVNCKRVDGSGRIAVFIGRFLSDCGVGRNFGSVRAVGFKLLRLRHNPLDCG